MKFCNQVLFTALAVILDNANCLLERRLLTQRNLIEALELLPAPKGIEEHRKQAISVMKPLDRAHYCRCGRRSKAGCKCSQPYVDQIATLSQSPRLILWSPTMYMTILERVMPYLYGKAERRVLHVGCGAGYLTAALYQAVSNLVLIP